MAHFTAALLDQAIQWADAAEIRVAVETGTFEAKTTRLLCNRLPIVHTIELEPKRWRHCVETAGHIGAVFHLGDSAVILPLLSAAYDDQPVIWYLDAHWFALESTGRHWAEPIADAARFPLWAELGTIVCRDTPDLLIVDDVHAFGRDELDWQSVSKCALDHLLRGRLRKSVIAGDQYLAALAKIPACPSSPA